MRDHTKKIKFCIYLIKENCPKKDIVKNSKKPLKFLLKDYNEDDMVLYVKQLMMKTPPWVRFFSNSLQKELSDIYTSGCAAVLVIRCGTRYFAFTFGYGRALLNLDQVEENFGLKVALNSIDPEKIKSVDTKNLDTVLRYSRVQTSRVSSVDNFGMNIDKDILNAVTGKSNCSYLGENISGADALYISIETAINELPNLCKKLLIKFAEKNYRRRFDWVDNITDIKSKSLINELDTSLVETINNKNPNFERLFLAVPELVDWTQFGGFRFNEKDMLREDVFFNDILVLYKKIDKNIDLAWLKHREVICYSSDAHQIINSWPLYKCINFENEKNNSTYLLHGGKWFEIDMNYVSSVRTRLKKIKNYMGFSFPVYSDVKEDDYNKKLAKMNIKKCYLMHGKNIQYGGGRSSIEFCDLIINRTEFVHIKRYRGSSALSHLFQQGFNSASIFLQDPEFQKKLNRLLPVELRFPSTKSLKSSDYEIVFAIISNAAGDIKELLPFFSKISLLHACNQLQAYGYRVSIVKIDMTDNTSRVND
jgi:uncharacterized protein (TIGR04141 family)